MWPPIRPTFLYVDIIITRHLPHLFVFMRPQLHREVHYFTTPLWFHPQVVAEVVPISPPDNFAPKSEGNLWPTLSFNM